MFLVGINDVSIDISEARGYMLYFVTVLESSFTKDNQ